MYSKTPTHQPPQPKRPQPLQPLQPQPPQVNASSWVLGWQFSAGERIQLQRDVFGDPGIFDVFLSAGAGAPRVAGRQGRQQRIAVFSE
jgi:hypothetical protein